MDLRGDGRTLSAARIGGVRHEEWGEENTRRLAEDELTDEERARLARGRCLNAVVSNRAPPISDEGDEAIHRYCKGEEVNK